MTQGDINNIEIELASIQEALDNNRTEYQRLMDRRRALLNQLRGVA